MQDAVRVEIMPRMMPADDDTIAHRTDTVQRMANLGLIDKPENGQVATQVTVGWAARINGVEVPLVTFGVEAVQPGQPMLLSLMVPADEVSIRATPDEPAPAITAPQPQAGTAEKPRRTWGQPGTPDPREGLPGWPPPSLGAQVAGSAYGNIA